MIELSVSVELKDGSFQHPKPFLSDAVPRIGELMNLEGLWARVWQNEWIVGANGMSVSIRALEVSDENN